jgi:HEAT repeat protein
VTRQRRADIVRAGHLGDVDTARAGLHDDDHGVRAAALGALRRLGALDSAALVAGLRDAHAAVRRRAAEEAAGLPAEPDVELVPLLRDADAAVVEAAAVALGERVPVEVGAVEALAAVAVVLAAVLAREAAIAALGSIGDPAGLPAVLAGCTDVATVRRRAVLALAAFEGDEVEATLHALVDDRDRQVRQAAEDLLHGWGISLDDG